MLIHDIKHEDKKNVTISDSDVSCKKTWHYLLLFNDTEGTRVARDTSRFIAAITTSFEKCLDFRHKNITTCVCVCVVRVWGMGEWGGGLLYFCWGDFMTVSIKQTLHTFLWDDRSLGNQIFGFIIFNSSWISCIFRGHIPLSQGDFVHHKLHIYTSSI